MSQNPREFPGVANKLTAPGKKSIFERQKAEAEAKRLKEEKETAAVYADFVKSFDNESDEDDEGGVFASGRPAFAPQGGFGKRHFTAHSGPGKLGSGPQRVSGPGSLGPAPSSLSRKRNYDGSAISDSKPGILGFDESSSTASAAKPGFRDSDDDEEGKDVKMKDSDRASARPTLHLTNIPPAIGSSAIKKLFPTSLTVENVRMLPLSGADSSDRRSGSAIVTLSADTPATEIEAAVSSLQREYLGWGHHLSLSRHLSSVAINTGLPSAAGQASSGSLPFGAKHAPKGPPVSLSRAPPPPGMGRQFAPPSSYGQSSAGSFAKGAGSIRVDVKPPTDVRQLKLIHKTVENVITHGPEFEALLMSRPSVQREEKWAWLWDARSPGGVWYRWRLWDIVTGASQRIKQGRGSNDESAQYVFEGGAIWQSEERALAYEYDTNIADFVSESEYDSSEDEDSGDEGRQRLTRMQGGSIPNAINSGQDEDAPSYLNPLRKAKLVHLLARLPSTTARLRRGDVARITAFAIKNASEGAKEVVDLITQNVHLPFIQTSANLDRSKTSSDSEDGRGSDEEEGSRDKEKESSSQQDLSSMKLIALYIISDILSSSSTSGIRHAWRYRQLFESSLRQRQTFAHLGRLEKEQGWGRLRAEKFKRSVNGVLSLWEGWCAFSAGSQEEFARDFNEPPLTEKEKEQERQRQEAEAREADKKKKAASGKWKTVLNDKARGSEGLAGSSDHQPQGGQATPSDGDAMQLDNNNNNGEDVDGEPMADDDGDDDEDLDGEPMAEDDEDLDGEAMPESSDEGDGGEGGSGEGAAAAMATEENSGMVGAGANADGDEEQRADAAASGGRVRRRPKAEDMFADSDGE